jgi:cyanophycinase
MATVPDVQHTRRLILIGGSEDKDGERLILSEVARFAGTGTLVIATLASEVPDLQWDRYQRIFRTLGVRNLAHLAITGREDALAARTLGVLDGASAVFFTGGDQVKITTKLKGTDLFTRIRDLYMRGALMAGTSAGASAMGESMLVGESTQEESHKVGGAFYMAHGLGLVGGLVIDQHFAQRARIERLIGAVAENPGGLAIGIDEDTAVVVDNESQFTVIGSGAVYVADGRTVTHTNMSEQMKGQTLCLFDVTLHVLSHNTGFDLTTRRPWAEGPPSVSEVKRTSANAVSSPTRA